MVRAMYFDHAATTPLHPEVLAAMLDICRGPVGNPSSIHAYGRAAKGKLTRARDSIATLLGCLPSELVFTSGGTESDNTAIRGVMAALHSSSKRHLITSASEHHAVLHTALQLEQEGFEVTLLEPDRNGLIHADQVRAAIRPDTALVSIMYANNETGTIQPVQEIGEAAKAAGVLYHVDAVQALGSLPLQLRELPVDLMSFSAHKLNGPLGIGALYIARGTPYQPLLVGGSQESKRRAGTENVAAAVGFAKAVELAVEGQEEKHARLCELRACFLQELTTHLGEHAYEINGDTERTLPHIVNVSLLGADTETMLMNLDMEGIAVSSGSACTSGSLERSHVLKAMRLPEARLNSAIRFSFGLGNTVEDIEYAAKKIATIVERIRTTV
ncbi:cysteine desulfurase family protein [Paenibacillus sp. SYP-B4298]|uniref:cysteine desulfurase family protein n=1 Tax=Paenibacillus sp. SYP-B4298 TaxID=2996034 RepID=UPI0022DE8F55|nr:cysteine desulfurase family protein [Paenibacillus sp. SYP-B4298]